MVGVGIRGLVRAARRATEDLRAGLTDVERPAFLERLGRDLRFVDEFLADEGMREADLPAPSRRAVEILRGISALPLSELPARPEGVERVKSVRLAGAEGVLGGLLESLERGNHAPELLARLRTRAGEAADTMEAACGAAGGTIATLTERSRRPIAMLRWLAAPGNLDRYAAAVTSAVRVLPRGLAAAGLYTPAETRVRFEPGPRVWTVSRSPGTYRWRLSPGFVAADEGDLEALPPVAALRRRAPESAQDRIHALLESEDFLATVAEIERIVAPRASRARGRAHDLDALFDRLDATYFHGSIERPRLEWAPTLSRERFGFYLSMHDVVCMNPLLDDPAVAASVVEFVLYHELLHKKHGSRLEGGRRHVHTPEFRAEERLHPHFDEADRVMHALAAGQSPAGSPPAVPLPAVPLREAPLPEAPRSAVPLPEVPPPRAAAPVHGRMLRFDAIVPPGAPPRTLARSPGPTRNGPCPCGSGRKYKRCHLDLDEAASARDVREP